MKKIKSKKSNFKDKTIKFFKELFHNPIGVLIDIVKYSNLYITTNIFFCLFVLFNVVNGIMVRYFTTGNNAQLTALQPLMADFAVVVGLGALGYFMRHRFRIIYWFIITLFCSLICVFNSIYYTYYSSYISVSLLSTAKYGEAVTDAIVEILKFKDFTYLILPICLVFVYFKLFKKKYFVEKESKNKQPKKAFSALVCAGIVGFLFVSSLNGTDFSRIT